jgi:hypothetical protein
MIGWAKIGFLDQLRMEGNGTAACSFISKPKAFIQLGDEGKIDLQDRVVACEAHQPMDVPDVSTSGHNSRMVLPSHSNQRALHVQ